MKILTIGAAGFLGSFVLKELTATGCELAGADFKDKPAELPATIAYRHVDVTDFENVREVVAWAKPDTVINLAGLLTNICASNPFQATRVNVMGAANVLEASRLTGVKRVVFASSAGVCSPDRIDTRETRPVSPQVSMYGATKFYDEVLCRQYEQNFGMETASLRYSLIYGPGDVSTPGNAQRLKNIESCVLGKDVVIDDASAEDRVHLLHVADAGRATAMAATSAAPVSGAYNISGPLGDFLSFGEIVDILRAAFPEAGQVMFGKGAAPQEFGLYSHRKAREAFGYVPHINARVGLVENGKNRLQKAG